MAVPVLIPIKRYPDYRTDQIGTHAQGLFLGGVVGAYLGGFHGIVFGLRNETGEYGVPHIEM